VGLGDRQVRPELRLLQDDADALPERGARMLGIEAQDLDLATVPCAVALEDLDRRRLPGAVRAEQAEDLARIDLEADPAQSLVGPVGLPELADGDRRRCQLLPTTKRRIAGLLRLPARSIATMVSVCAPRRRSAIRAAFNSG
jgi:hypothetical protein